MNGEVDNLLGLVNLVHRVASTESKAERRERNLSSPSPTFVPAGGGGEVSGGKVLLGGVLLLVVLPLLITLLVVAVLRGC